MTEKMITHQMTKTDFDARHGQPLMTGGRWLYPDGAIFHADERPGHCKEPPYEDHERVQLIREYQQVKALAEREPFVMFAGRQGCKHRPINGRILFANGAQSNGQYTHSNPPVDTVARLNLQREYLQDVLRVEVLAWEKYQAECLGILTLAQRYPNLPGPPDDAADRLERGKERIERLRAEIAAIEAQLPEPPQVRAAKARGAVSTARLHSLNETEDAIRNLQI